MFKCPSPRPQPRALNQSQGQGQGAQKVLHTSQASIAGTQQANCCRATVNQFVACWSSEAVEYTTRQHRCVDNLSCGAEIVIDLVFLSHDKNVFCLQCLVTIHHSYKACRRRQLSIKINSIAYGHFSCIWNFPVDLDII